MTLIDKTQIKPRTHVFLLLDSSGSMNTIRQAAINHFNEQVDDLRSKSEEHDIDVSLITFSGQSELLRSCAPVSEISKLTLDEYDPCGATAIYDAIGYGIREIQKQCDDLADENTAVLFKIITDGDENSSREFTQAKINSLIEELKPQGWTFTFMAANVDPLKLAQTMGVSQSNVMRFNANVKGVVQAGIIGQVADHGYFNMRSAGVRSSSSFYSGTPGDMVDGNAELANQGKKLVDSKA